MRRFNHNLYVLSGNVIGLQFTANNYVFYCNVKFMKIKKKESKFLLLFVCHTFGTFILFFI